jgi:sulfite reductase (NADPH) flavoprotein alpha-component
MHKKIWFKIHWILGITAGIVLFVVGVTGAVLSFEKEITRFINQDSFIVSVPENKTKLSTKELLEKFQAINPKAKINSVSITNEPSSSVVINVAGIGEGKEARRGVNYYLNPYTAEILPDLKGKEFFSLMLRLHRWLALEGDAREVGKQTVAISTVALIVLVISGIIVYWGRIKHSFFKSFTFKFKHKGRAFLSTMHSAIGMWVIPFYLLAALTGLYWSYGWYNTMLYKIAGVEKPQRMMPPKEQQKVEGQKVEQKPIAQAPRGEKPKRDISQMGENSKIQVQRREENSQSKFADVQKAIDMFNIFIQKDYYSFTVRLPQKGTIYSFTYLDDKSDYFRHSNTLELDINSWQLLKDDRFKEKPLNEQLMRSILPLHTGEYFGIIGQIGMFLASSLMALFVITGFMLFINRHKKKKAKK